MNPTPVKACIFDLDGVIVDTAGYHFKAWKRLANELGCDFTEHDNERLKGVSRIRSLEIILEINNLSLSEDKIIELANKKNQWYVEDILKMTPAEILPGVVDFMTSIRSAGIKTALGSASKNSATILERINLASYFDAIVDGNKVSLAKPDPEVFLLGAKELGVDPEECVVFEDAIAGIEAAKNAGMRCVGVGSPEVLSEADYVISSFKEMNLNRLRSDF